MLRHFPHLQPLLLLQKEAVPQGEAEAEDSHKNCLLQSSLYYLNKEAGGRRQEAGGRRQEAGGRRQEAGGRRQDDFYFTDCFECQAVYGLLSKCLYWDPKQSIWKQRMKGCLEQDKHLKRKLKMMIWWGNIKWSCWNLRMINLNILNRVAPLEASRSAKYAKYLYET